jgi:hypothetical protein
MKHYGKTDRLLHPGATSAEIRCDHAVTPWDRVAVAMERKWGQGRLHSLVSPALAERYGAAVAHMHACMDAGDSAATAAAAENCIKGLIKMDAEAVAAGHKTPAVTAWQIEYEGRKYAIIQDVANWQIAELQYPGWQIVTLREAAVSLHSFKGAIAAGNIIKSAFPGAEISAIRDNPKMEGVLEDALDDFVPF